MLSLNISKHLIYSLSEYLLTAYFRPDIVLWAKETTEKENIKLTF